MRDGEQLVVDKICNYASAIAIAMRPAFSSVLSVRCIDSKHRFYLIVDDLIVAARSATAKVFRNPAVASIRAI